MSIIVYPSELSGTLSAPASKSYAQRMLICAALSDAPSELLCGNICSDVRAMIDCLNALGASIAVNGDRICIRPIDRNNTDNVSLYCGESGASLRFLLPLVCALGFDAEIDMGESLRKRPVGSLIDELVRCGADISRDGDGHIIVRGTLRENEFYIPADVSSQYVSGLMLSFAAVGGGAVNITSNIHSMPYIKMTADCLERCGVGVALDRKRISVSGRPHCRATVTCEADWSGAAFWLCAAAIGKKPLTVTGLKPDSFQADTAMIKCIERLGASVRLSDNAVTVFPAKLRASVFDASDTPDLVPALSLLCACADGESRISGIQRLRSKESDRILSVCDMINSLGSTAAYDEGSIIIRGGGLKGGFVKSYSDHRIAMAAAVASNVCREPIIIDDFDCCKKSYLGFADDFLRCGGHYEYI